MVANSLEAGTVDRRRPAAARTNSSEDQQHWQLHQRWLQWKEGEGRITGFKPATPDLFLETMKKNRIKKLMLLTP